MLAERWIGDAIAAASAPPTAESGACRFEVIRHQFR
jgi:hypothetical protein